MAYQYRFPPLQPSGQQMLNRPPTVPFTKFPQLPRVSQPIPTRLPSGVPHIPIPASSLLPAAKALGAIGFLLQAPSIIQDTGASVGYLWNLPQTINNALESDRLRELIKKRERSANLQKQARDADSARINNYPPPDPATANSFVGGGVHYLDMGGTRHFGTFSIAGAFSIITVSANPSQPGASQFMRAVNSAGALIYQAPTPLPDIIRPMPSAVRQPSSLLYPAEPPTGYPARTPDNSQVWQYGSPTVKVGGAPFPTAGKPFKEPEAPKPFNAKPAPSGNSSGNEPDKGIKRTPSGFPQISSPSSSPSSGASSANSKPSFTAKPFVSGVSDPSELGNPVDVKSGLTRAAQDKQWQEQNQAVQDRAKANERASAANDAKAIQQQLQNLSDVPRSDLGGKSARQQQTEAYQNSIRGNEVRESAFKIAQQTTTATQNSTPSTPVSTGNNVLQNVAGLAGIAATVTALKLGSDLLVNNSISNTPKIDNINANTTPQAQQTNAKQGVCDAMQPDQCGFQGVQAATAPIAAGVTANSGVLAQILAAIANLVTLITTLFSNLGKVTDAILNNQFVTHAMNYITMISAVHNAAMLSRGLLDTLGSALDSGLQIFGLQLKDKDNNQIGISQAIGTSFQNMIKGIIGVDNWTALNATWVNANRIYQSGINLLSNVQSIIDSTTAVVELTNNRLGTFMNSVRSAGGVRENAYGAQSENVNRFNANLQRLQNLEEGVSNLASITGNIVSVQQSVSEITANRTEFQNALTDKPVGTGLPENTPQKTVADTKKADSKWTIADFSIVKAPEVP